jgi:ribosomal protein L30E
VPSDLADILRSGLVQRICSSLGLARRAGQAVAGFEKAREMLRAGKARLIMQASDGSEAERARFLTGLGPGFTVIDPIPGADLGRVFGRDYVVHVAVAPGKLADQLVLESGRLAGLTNRSNGTTRRYAASEHDVAGTDEDT